jgi:hypothetical protein
MRRTAVITAGSVVAALAVGGVLAVAGGAEAPAATTIKLVTKNCTHTTIDVPPRMRGRNSPPGAGDGTAGSCRLLDTAGARAGTLDVACLFPRGIGRTGGAGICHGTYALAGGDIHVVVRAHSEDVSGAIVGGTGSYIGARGTFTSIERRGDQERTGSPKDDTIVLLP